MAPSRGPPRMRPSPAGLAFCCSSCTRTCSATTVTQGWRFPKYLLAGRATPGDEGSSGGGGAVSGAPDSRVWINWLALRRSLDSTAPRGGHCNETLAATRLRRARCRCPKAPGAQRTEVHAYQPPLEAILFAENGFSTLDPQRLKSTHSVEPVPSRVISFFEKSTPLAASSTFSASRPPKLPAWCILAPARTPFLRGSTPGPMYPLFI